MSDLMSNEEIAEITRDTWTAMLAADDVYEGSASSAPEITAAVDIGGAWEGSAYLSLSVAAARRAAATMFDVEPADVSGQDVEDAVCELINIVGGNIKGGLPTPTTLSLPRLCDSETEQGSELVREVVLIWRDEPVRVTVWS